MSDKLTAALERLLADEESGDAFNCGCWVCDTDQGVEQECTASGPKALRPLVGLARYGAGIAKHHRIERPLSEPCQCGTCRAAAALLAALGDGDAE